MPEILSNLQQTKRGVAALATCIVQTLNETDSTFQDRFVGRLERTYREIREQGVGSDNSNEALEILAWTRHLLTGFNWAEGQGRPFLEE